MKTDPFPIHVCLYCIFGRPRHQSQPSALHHNVLFSLKHFRNNEIVIINYFLLKKKLTLLKRQIWIHQFSSTGYHIDAGEMHAQSINIIAVVRKMISCLFMRNEKWNAKSLVQDLILDHRLHFLTMAAVTTNAPHCRWRVSTILVHWWIYAFIPIVNSSL